jgi:AhpC/TSA family protein
MMSVGTMGPLRHALPIRFSYREEVLMRVLLWPAALLLGAGLWASCATAQAQDAKKEGAKKVTEGQPAPDVELPATTIDKGKTLRLKDYQGKKNVVLYFFPKAATPG